MCCVLCVCASLCGQVNRKARMVLDSVDGQFPTVTCTCDVNLLAGACDAQSVCEYCCPTDPCYLLTLTVTCPFPSDYRHGGEDWHWQHQG